MSKRNAVADATPREAIPLTGDQLAEVPVQTNSAVVQPEGPVDGDKRKPAASWCVQSDRTTTVELACWTNTHRTQGGEEYEHLSFTVTRSYKNQDDQWVKGGSWRTHDIPVLMFLLSKAHAYALDNRTHITPDCPI